MCEQPTCACPAAAQRTWPQSNLRPSGPARECAAVPARLGHGAGLAVEKTRAACQHSPVLHAVRAHLGVVFIAVRHKSVPDAAAVERLHLPEQGCEKRVVGCGGGRDGGGGGAPQTPARCLHVHPSFYQYAHHTARAREHRERAGPRGTKAVASPGERPALSPKLPVQRQCGLGRAHTRHRGRQRLCRFETEASDDTGCWRDQDRAGRSMCVPMEEAGSRALPMQRATPWPPRLPLFEVWSACRFAQIATMAQAFRPDAILQQARNNNAAGVRALVEAGVPVEFCNQVRRAGLQQR